MDDTKSMSSEGQDAPLGSRYTLVVNGRDAMLSNGEPKRLILASSANTAGATDESIGRRCKVSGPDVTGAADDGVR
jgi:hypothetical protein